MPARLDPAERERRAKARAKARWEQMKSGEAYAHYDPRTEGYGSEEQWRDTADRVVHGVIKPAPKVDADLMLLNLTEMPTDERALTRAYRLQSRVVHPDADGGSHDAFLALNAAYERLKLKVKAKAKR